MKSEARFTPFFKALSVFLFVPVIGIPVYVKASDPGNPDSAYYLRLLNFIAVIAVAFSAGAGIWLVLMFRGKTIWITDKHITVKYFLREPVHDPLASITKILWGSAAGRSLVTGPLAMRGRSRADDVLIEFEGGASLYFHVGEYSNFDALRGWFLTYGKKTGLIRSR